MSVMELGVLSAFPLASSCELAGKTYRLSSKLVDAVSYCEFIGVMTRALGGKGLRNEK